MSARPVVRHLAALLLLPSALALAMPQNGEVVQPPPRPWVTVDAAGVGVTQTPTVVTTGGSTMTLNEAPSSLLAVATHTLVPAPDSTTTYTGFPPVATATGTGESRDAGTFLACTEYQHADAPFCAPLRGALLYPGYTYYVTWSPGNFAPNDQRLLEVHVSWDGPEGDVGMRAAEKVRASVGFYPWHVPDTFLSSRGLRALNVTFWLQEDMVETADPNDARPWQGPSAYIIEGRPSSTGGGSQVAGTKTNVVAIAVPLVVGVVLLLLGGLCFCSWRRHGTVPIVGALAAAKRKSGGGGYGVRQSRSERVAGRGVNAVGDDKAGPNVGIQLTDRDSWSPTGTGAGSRNVFREELQRQERQR